MKIIFLLEGKVGMSTSSLTQESTSDSQPIEDQAEIGPPESPYQLLCHCGRVNFNLPIPDRATALLLAQEINQPQIGQEIFSNVLEQLKMKDDWWLDTQREIADHRWWFEFCTSLAHKRLGPCGLMVSRIRDSQVKPEERYERVKRVFEEMRFKDEVYSGKRFLEDYDGYDIDWNDPQYDLFRLYQQFYSRQTDDRFDYHSLRHKYRDYEDYLHSHARYLHLKLWDEPVEYDVIMFEIIEVPIGLKPQKGFIKWADVQSVSADDCKLGLTTFRPDRQDLKYGAFAYDQILHPSPEEINHQPVTSQSQPQEEQLESQSEILIDQDDERNE